MKTGSILFILDAQDDLDCNRKWVRDIFKRLVAGAIISQIQADNVSLELETSSEL